MLLRRLILALLLLGSVAGLSAQDIHYTLHNYSPLWLNPANTGAFYGSIRVSGHYRGQYLGTNGINTPGISIDAPVIRGLRKQDWIGAGANLIMDQANASAVDIVRQVFAFSGAYHLSLDKKQRNVLTLGAQYTSVSIGLDENIGGDQELNIEQIFGGLGQTGQFERFMVGGGMSNQNQGPRQSYSDISAGLMYRTVFDVKKNNRMELGLSMQHINNGQYQTLLGATSAPDTIEIAGDGSRESRSPGQTLHAHANLDIEMAENIRFMPTVFWQSNRGNSSVSLQAWAGLELKNEMVFKFGLGYRTADAGKILLGFTKDRLNVAASYDVVLSQAVPNNLGSLNSVEIAANYIFNIYKKPETKPSILCPRI